MIDAEGRRVTPAFLNLHCNLDAQVGWDPLMSSSCWHGVTSVVMSNCGMTFASLWPGHAQTHANIIESVEGIPADGALQGLDWGWKTYSEYLDALDALSKGINSCGYVCDVALQTQVCADAAFDEDFAASPEQPAEMAALVQEALLAGAVGYSISQSLTHRMPDGRWMPGATRPSSHLDPDVEQYDTEALRQVHETVADGFQQEVQCSEPEDRDKR